MPRCDLQLIYEPASAKSRAERFGARCNRIVDSFRSRSLVGGIRPRENTRGGEYGSLPPDSYTNLLRFIMGPTMANGSDVVILEFDGSSKGNPGHSGYGFLLKAGDREITDSGYIGDEVTNNQAEYTALLQGLKRADDEGISRIQVRGDSELIIKQMTGEYSVNSDNIADLYEAVCEVANQFETLNFEHIERGSNSIADKLAQEAAKQ